MILKNVLPKIHELSSGESALKKSFGLREADYRCTI